MPCSSACLELRLTSSLFYLLAQAAHQTAYLDYIVASEKLDQFMRQKQQEDILVSSRTAAAGEADGGGSASSEAVLAALDDDASSIIFKMKRLSLAGFRGVRQHSRSK